MELSEVRMGELRTAVDKGAAWLDRVKPGWREMIDIGSLQMDRCDRCILGQLYGDYFDAIYTSPTLGSKDSACRHGFQAEGDSTLYADEYHSDRTAKYEALRSLWIAKITQETAS